MQQQKSRQKKIDIKEIRLSIRIGEHDLKMRVDQGYKFLSKGDKLKISVVLRGRERQHPEKAEETINHYLKQLEALMDQTLSIEEPLTKLNDRLSIVVVNKK